MALNINMNAFRNVWRSKMTVNTYIDSKS